MLFLRGMAFLCCLQEEGVLTCNGEGWTSTVASSTQMSPILLFFFNQVPDCGIENLPSLRT